MRSPQFTFSLLPLRLVRYGVLALCLAAGSAGAVDVGQVAPAFDLPSTQANSRIKLADLRGKWVYVDFWASWCGPCKQSFPWMNDMLARYGKQGLNIVAINLDADSADAQAFLAANSAKFTIVFDPKGQTPKQYGVKGMPSSFLIAPDGNLVWQHSGFRSDDKATLELAFRKALGLKP